MTIPIRGASLALLAALACILIVLWTNRPATHAAVVVNSDPVGVTFELVQDDGSVVDLGRTPFILRDVGLGESVDIRPIYEDGAPGEIRSVAPDRLEVFDACRQLLVEFETNP